MRVVCRVSFPAKTFFLEKESRQFMYTIRSLHEKFSISLHPILDLESQRTRSTKSYIMPSSKGTPTLPPSTIETSQNQFARESFILFFDFQILLSLFFSFFKMKKINNLQIPFPFG